MKAPSVPPLVFENGTLILPDRLIEGGTLVCEKGKITALEKPETLPKNAVVIDAKGGYVSPGFIDIHVHGGGGADFMDATVDAVRTVLHAHARHGTTTIFPTTTTGASVQIMAMLGACREAKRTWQVEHGSRIAGVHLYGPYFAADKVGCHSRAGRRAPSETEYAMWFRDDLIRIATCAAELPGAEAFYQLAKKQGCLITCGHSNSNWAEMEKAYKAGMRHVDHFWCAMSSVGSLRTRLGTPMQASMEQFVLAMKEMSTEVIADGMHLSPELLDFAFKMKGVERLCLVTDCNRALDMAPGRYRFGSDDDGPFFESDGKVGFVPGQGLASAVVGMDHMVRHMKKSTSATLPEAVRMASLTPAERTGMAKTCGSLEKGKQADVLILSRRLDVQRTFISGVEVPRD